MSLDGKCPDGPLADRWKNHKANNLKLVGPINRRKYKVIVVGSGLAGASAAATLAEQGYQVTCISFHDSPRRAHSIAAQGGINAAKNYQNDNEVHSVCSMIPSGGDFARVECLPVSWVSENIIDQAVSQGVPSLVSTVAL